MTAPKIGILCPSDTELAPFLPHLQNGKTDEAAMLTFHEGTLVGLPCVCLYSGVGKGNAALSAQLLIDRFRPDAVICAGVAGALDDSLRCFDIVISEALAYHDMADDILTEFHPWMPSPFFHADESLLSAARASAQAYPAGAVRFGVCVTGEAFIEGGEVRASIQRRFSPLSVDMESAAFAHACYVNRVPFLAVRTVTDAASEGSAEVFEDHVERASQIAADFVLNMLEGLSGRSPKP